MTVTYKPMGEGDRCPCIKCRYGKEMHDAAEAATVGMIEEVFTRVPDKNSRLLNSLAWAHAGAFLVYKEQGLEALRALLKDIEVRATQDAADNARSSSSIN